MTQSCEMYSPDPTRERSGSDLLAAIATGDSLAFHRLYQAWAGKLHATVLRILRDPAQTEEVIQDLFLEVWLHADRFQANKGSAAAYLRRLATSRAIDRVRASQTHRDYTLHAGTEHFHAGTSALTRVHDDWELRYDVRQSLARLTRLQREVLELVYFHEFTQVEIAGRLGVPVGTVKSRINSALTSLRRSSQEETV